MNEYDRITKNGKIPGQVTEHRMVQLQKALQKCPKDKIVHEARNCPSLKRMAENLIYDAEMSRYLKLAMAVLGIERSNDPIEMLKSEEYKSY